MSLKSRIIGGIQIIGGGLEVVLGATGMAVPEPLTTAGGVVLVVHGSDTVIAGFRSLWYGEVKESMTKQAVEGTAKALGASPNMAGTIGTTFDIAAGLGPSSGIAISRQFAMSAAKNSSTKIAIAYIPKNASERSIGHNMVGIFAKDGPTGWYHYAGKNPGRFMKSRTPPADKQIAASFAISSSKASQAQGEISRLVD